jgi:hypothetical protein
MLAFTLISAVPVEPRSYQSHPRRVHDTLRSRHGISRPWTRTGCRGSYLLLITIALASGQRTWHRLARNNPATAVNNSPSTSSMDLLQKDFVYAWAALHAYLRRASGIPRIIGRVLQRQPELPYCAKNIRFVQLERCFVSVLF